MALDATRLGPKLAQAVQDAKPAPNAQITTTQLEAMWTVIAQEIIDEFTANGIVTVNKCSTRARNCERGHFVTQLKMDDNDDLAIENNKFVLTSNNSDEEIRQRLLQRLRFFYGEWFLETTKGIPYFQAVFVKGTPPDIIEGIFKETIIATEGVVSLTRFEPLDFNTATRELTVDFDVQTINSDTLTINEAIP